MKRSKHKYRKLCEYIAERDIMCVQCGLQPSVDPHHVIPRSQGGLDSTNNVIGVCRYCHDWFHANTREHKPKDEVLEMLIGELAPAR